MRISTGDFNKRMGWFSYPAYFKLLDLLRLYEILYRKDKISTEEFRGIGRLLQSADMTNWEIAKLIMESKSKI